MPKPSKGESKEDYISRCMAEPQMNDEFPEQKQRAAVCYSYWDRKDEAEEKPLTFKQFLMTEDE